MNELSKDDARVTVESLLALGEVEEVAEMVKRLMRLPEFGMTAHVRKVDAAVKAVDEAAKALKDAKTQLREQALNLLAACCRNYSREEIMHVTGHLPGMGR